MFGREQRVNSVACHEDFVLLELAFTIVFDKDLTIPNPSPVLPDAVQRGSNQNWDLQV